MAIEKKSLISNRATAKKAVIAKSSLEPKTVATKSRGALNTSRGALNTSRGALNTSRGVLSASRMDTKVAFKSGFSTKSVFSKTAMNSKTVMN